MGIRNKLTLLSNAGAGNGASFVQPGGKYTMIGEATYGGGSQKLQMKTENGTFVDVAGSTLSAAGTLTVELPPGEVRCVATTATVNYVSLVPVYQVN